MVRVRRSFKNDFKILIIWKIAFAHMEYNVQNMEKALLSLTLICQAHYSTNSLHQHFKKEQSGLSCYKG